jgi:hypothetical protein
MIREKLIDKGIGDNKKFRWRSTEISRIEGLSDGVFDLLYWHAYRRRSLLGLNHLEIFDTREDIQESALNVGIGALSITLSLWAEADSQVWQG